MWDCSWVMGLLLHALEERFVVWVREVFDPETFRSLLFGGHVPLALESGIAGTTYGVADRCECSFGPAVVGQCLVVERIGVAAEDDVALAVYDCFQEADVVVVRHLMAVSLRVAAGLRMVRWIAVE